MWFAQNSGQFERLKNLTVVSLQERIAITVMPGQEVLRKRWLGIFMVMILV